MPTLSQVSFASLVLRYVHAQAAGSYGIAADAMADIRAALAFRS